MKCRKCKCTILLNSNSWFRIRINLISTTLIACKKISGDELFLKTPLYFRFTRFNLQNKVLTEHCESRSTPTRPQMQIYSAPAYLLSPCVRKHIVADYRRNIMSWPVTITATTRRTKTQTCSPWQGSILGRDTPSPPTLPTPGTTSDNTNISHLIGRPGRLPVRYNIDL